MSHPEIARKAAIDVKAKLPEKYMITNLGPARQFIFIEIYSEDNRTGISLGEKAYITTILELLGMDHSHGVSTAMDPYIKLHLAKDRGEKKSKDITDPQAVVGSLMNEALATRPDMSYAVAGLPPYNLWPLTIHMTATTRVLQYLIC